LGSGVFSSRAPTSYTVIWKSDLNEEPLFV
jgi:hypothetical protein